MLSNNSRRKRTLRIGKIPYHVEKFYYFWEDVNKHLPQTYPGTKEGGDFRKFRKNLYRHIKYLRACTPLTSYVKF